MMFGYCLAPLSLFIAAMVASTGFSAEVTIERSDKGAVVKIDGQLFTEYLIRSGSKPILWPIIGPTGKPMTRAYPMRNTGKEARDHPHQASLWFTHGDVNGIDFWSEPRSFPPGYKFPPGHKHQWGAVEHVKFLKVASGKPAIIVTQNNWLGPDGKKVCEDERTLRFNTDGDARWIDFDVTLKATDGPVTFGDTKEGGFSVRVAETLRVDAKRGGQIVNSRNQVDEAAWGKPAEWVDYHGPVDGQTVGIAIFNHPASFRFPAYWHVRDYGLFAANPFGLYDFAGGESGRGAVTLSPGQTLALRYRMLLHRGDEKAGKVAESFAAYTLETK